MRRRTARLATLLALAVLLCFTLGTLGKHHWALDLFAHFRIQYTAVLLACAVLLAVCKAPWRAAALALCTIPLALSLFIYSERSFAKQAPPNYAFRLVHFNVLTSNTNHSRVLDYLESSQADLICLQEVNARWMTAIRARTSWEVVIDASREDNFGMTLLRPHSARVLVEHARAIDLTPGALGIPAIEARLITHGQRHPENDGHRTAMLFVHTLPPVNGRNARVRDAMLERAGDWVNAQHEPALIMGDLNATPWCAPFKRLLTDTGLRNTMVSHGLARSWPTRLPALFRIPIDHCLATPEWGWIRLGGDRLGPHLGSDHLPLVVRIGPRFDPPEPAPGAPPDAP